MGMKSDISLRPIRLCETRTSEECCYGHWRSYLGNSVVHRQYRAAPDRNRCRCSVQLLASSAAAKPFPTEMLCTNSSVVAGEVGGFGEEDNSC